LARRVASPRPVDPAGWRQQVFEAWPVAPWQEEAAEVGGSRFFWLGLKKDVRKRAGTRVVYLHAKVLVA